MCALAVPGVSERFDAVGVVEVPENQSDADEPVRGVRKWDGPALLLPRRRLKVARGTQIVGDSPPSGPAAWAPQHGREG